MEKVAQKRADGGRGLLLLVKGDTGEEMVDDVGVDDAVEEVAADPAEVAVDGGQGTLDVGPALGVIVVDLGVVVVEVCDGNCMVSKGRKYQAGNGTEKRDILSQWWTQT